MVPSIELFPTEVLTHIFSYLEPRHRQNVALVCKRWKEALEVRGFYTTFVFKHIMQVDAERLDIFRTSYHPFTKLHFENVKNFVIDDLFREFCCEIKKINEVTFINCYGLDDDLFIKIMKELNIVTVNLIGINSLKANKLKKIFPAVKCLKLDEGYFVKSNLTAFLKSFPSIETLYLRCDEFNTSLDWIKELSRWIPNIYLSCEFVDHLIPEGIIQQLITFEKIKIIRWNSLLNGISDAVFLKLVTKFKDNLQSLTIQNAGILPMEKYELINLHCTSLEKLYMKFLSQCPYKIVELLSNLQRLNTIDIHFETKNTSDLVFLSKKMKFLSMNSLKSNEIPSHFDLVLDAVPNLRHLSLSRCTLEAEDLSMIFTKCPKLRSFALFNVKTHLESCKDFFKLEYLESLSLEYCDVSEEVLEKIPWHGLHELVLSNSKSISKYGIKALVQNCPNIERLGLFRCGNIDDGCIDILTSHFPQLEYLNVEKTRITHEGYELLKKRIKEVQYDDIDFILESLNGFRNP